jgi:hypothetical protein
MRLLKGGLQQKHFIPIGKAIESHVLQLNLETQSDAAICLREIIGNFKQHWPKALHTKYLKYRVINSNKGLQITIEVPCTSYQFKLPIITNAPSPDQEKGRGLFLIKLLSSDFKFIVKKSRIALTFEHHGDILFCRRRSKPNSSKNPL